MPLTSKGEKLRDKFRGQYGKKKGDSIFYAMENSGKLKKVIKARGGMDASKADFKTPSTTAKAPPSQGFGNPPTQVTTSSQQNTTKKGLPEIGGVKVMGPSSLALGLAKQFIFDPLTKKSRTQKVRGETLFGKAKGLPASRDYYRSFGEPIDVMSKKGTDYMKEAGLITERKDTKQKDGPNLCPDGVSRPPCPPTSKPAKAQPAKPAPGGKPKSDFLKDFIFYPFNKGGGVPYGPPPERGPNPQVPPVKLRNGNLTKKYKMSCPHRPEGIRGVGRAIRGHKFTGVK